MGAEEADKDIWELFNSLMEGYSDSVIPLLSDLQTENKNNINDDSSTQIIRNNQQISMKACSSRKKAKTEASSSSVPMEIKKERERREKMTIQFSVLQSMLPNISPKAQRTQIVEETIDYIKNLEEELKGLEAKKKAAAMEFSSARPSTSIIPIYTPHHQNSVVNVTVSGNVAFFGIHTEVQRFLFTRVMKVFKKYKTEILTSTVTTNEQKITVSVTAVVNGNEGGRRGSDIEAIKGDLIRLFCLKV
ncbi:Myc-type [Macleaya cordata]|uniref:Myc-type n=1 Tax=Macleaya cordata TaxID=56857 RepID=A0A200QX86_MACCD|nr:Myc-type [Macleaya cordata]